MGVKYCSKIPIKIHTCGKIYAVVINTGKMIRNKTEKDKNVHKDAQGLLFLKVVSYAHQGCIYNKKKNAILWNIITI